MLCGIIIFKSASFWQLQILAIQVKLITPLPHPHTSASWYQIQITENWDACFKEKNSPRSGPAKWYWWLWAPLKRGLLVGSCSICYNKQVNPANGVQVEGVIIWLLLGVFGVGKKPDFLFINFSAFPSANYCIRLSSLLVKLALKKWSGRYWTTIWSWWTFHK